MPEVGTTPRITRGPAEPIRSDQDCVPLSWTRERADTLFRLRASEEGSGFQAQSSASEASNQTPSEPLDPDRAPLC
jgi:hypothetical protein